ncbi:unnamed protein product [Kluyveromyces dobzhanskii CBS 2104]|uniref:WGS project CCBQ000000000 data, contig 00098 n=1 Tax=Kluyveromyces dobzhanskii CBS 2104 TaxID=1427455 RepID=A0A0A8L313_9SACH|nr:unnamed protein product [Kluyveromyces dobzhanskii CBS 2104]
MTNTFDGFVPIHTIFYTIFHPTEGSKVRFQFPPNSLENGDIDFDTIKNYVIPKPQLCNKLLTFKYRDYRIVCYPVNVNARYYARNSFNFDFVFVFPYDCATSPYEPAIARLGKMFKVLEEQSQILSKAEQDPVYFQLKPKDTNTTDQSTEMGSLTLSEHTDIKSSGDDVEKYLGIMKEIAKDKKNLIIEDLLMKLFLDLNNYSECLIPIDEGNSIDIKLFPVRTPPSSNISIEDVPIAIVNLSDIIDVNWDPTMVKIVPYINGINSIAQIAASAQSDVELVQECIKHLMYYKCIILSDIFQFSNIYAPKNEIHNFLLNPAMAKACQNFVQTNSLKLGLLPFDGRPNNIHPTGRKQASTSTIPSRRHDSNETNTTGSVGSVRDGNRNFLSSSSTSSYLKSHGSESMSLGTTENVHKRVLPTKSCLFDLYRSLSQGKTVKDWYKQNFEIIRDNRIDVRRFITFGITRRLIYRVNSYPIVKNVGTWDILKTLVASEPKAKYASGKSKNIFSAGDIKVVDNKEEENKDDRLDAADELLKNLYQKLSLKQDVPDTMNKFTRFYDGNSSNPNLTEASSRKSSLGSQQKVSFDFGTVNRHKTSIEPPNSQDADKAELWKMRKEEELILLESLRNAETFDKICTKLKKSRHEVDLLLKELGHYNIVNS